MFLSKRKQKMLIFVLSEMIPFYQIALKWLCEDLCLLTIAVSVVFRYSG